MTKYYWFALLKQKTPRKALFTSIIAKQSTHQKKKFKYINVVFPVVDYVLITIVAV